MNTGCRYIVNSPHVVYETIDGETIIMDLRTGNYYSIEWPAAFIWEFIGKAGDMGVLIDALLSEEGMNKNASSDIHSFIQELLKESLLVQNDEQTGTSEISEEMRQEITKLAQNFKRPELNKYTDMQDMLLLDPIHDVDEKGWPEPKKQNG